MGHGRLGKRFLPRLVMLEKFPLPWAFVGVFPDKRAGARGGGERAGKWGKFDFAAGEEFGCGFPWENCGHPVVDVRHGRGGGRGDHRVAWSQFGVFLPDAGDPEPIAIFRVGDFVGLFSPSPFAPFVVGRYWDEAASVVKRFFPYGRFQFVGAAVVDGGVEGAVESPAHGVWGERVFFRGSPGENRDTRVGFPDQGRIEFF